MQANNASGYQAEVFSVVWDEVRLAVVAIGAAAMGALAAGADASTSAAGALASTRMTWRLSSYCLTKSTARSAERVDDGRTADEANAGQRSRDGEDDADRAGEGGEHLISGALRLRESASEW